MFVNMSEGEMDSALLLRILNVVLSANQVAEGGEGENVVPVSFYFLPAIEYQTKNVKMPQIAFVTGPPFHGKQTGTDQRK